ncbi:MAG: D-glucuronyl C5-epimerase family protein [Odoribacter sp.]
MMKKFFIDLNSNRHIPINSDNNTKELNFYYIRFEENLAKLNHLIHSFDPNGIPLNSTYIDVEESKLHYYPISIGQVGLAVFHSWLININEDKEAHFVQIFKWFMDNRIEDEKLGVYWETDVPKPEYNVYTPWKSAFSQSRGISILLRAWQLSGDEQYLAVASRALIPFQYDISEGGVSVDRASGETFYEEYVASAPTRVLDGHNFSLFGLYDYIRAVTDEKYAAQRQLAIRLFEEGIEGLIRQLPKFDLGFWLRFNRCDLPNYPQNDPCTIGYLRLVCAQLKILGQLSGRSELLEYSRKYKKYSSFFNILRMYYLKYRALRKLNRL